MIDKKKIDNILITSAGRRVRLVENFQETLKRFNPEGKIFVADMSPEMSSASYVSDGFFKLPPVMEREYIDRLAEVAMDNKVSIIVPTIDTELLILSKNKKIFENEGIRVVVSSEEICSTFSSKIKTEMFFLSMGLKTPRILDADSDVEFPIFAKLDNSSRSIGACRVDSKEKMNELKKSSELYIFQEYIEGDEFTVDVFVDSNSKIISVVPRQRLEVRSGEVSKALTIKNSDIIRSVKELVGKMKGVYGPLSIQLFKKNGELFFIEVNPRFGGGYPLTWICGSNFAEYIIKDYLGVALTYEEKWKDHMLMLRYDAEVVVPWL